MWKKKILFSIILLVIKLLYPNGNKKEYKKNIINYKNRGMELESLINEANEYYLEKDIALIYKKPTPIGLIDVDYKEGIIKKAYFKEKSTLDYNGIYKGKYIDFDAKESHIRTSFPLSYVHTHQINHIKKVIDHGGISFLIIYINDMYYILKGEDLISFIETNTRKSIPYDYIKEKGYKIDLTLRPTLNYLKVLDDIYFKGESL